MSFQFQFGSYKNPGGSLNFSEMSEFQIWTFIDGEKWACIRCVRCNVSDTMCKYMYCEKHAGAAQEPPADELMQRSQHVSTIRNIGATPQQI